jgi:hypothetical protein
MIFKLARYLFDQFVEIRDRWAGPNPSKPLPTWTPSAPITSMCSLISLI